MAAVQTGNGLIVITPVFTASLAHDNGVSDSDGVTNDDTVTGTAQNAGTITFTDGNGTKLGTVTTTQANQTYTFDPAAGGNINIGQGAQTITATATVNGRPVTASVALTYDTTAPTYGQGTATPAAGSDLGAGRTVTFTVATSEPVTVTEANGGAPVLHLNTNGEAATYTGPVGQAVSSLVFSYTVQPGDNVADLVAGAIGALPAGTTIRDGAGNDIDPSSFKAIDTGIQVDTRAPAAPPAPSDASVMNGYVNAAHDTAAQTITGTAEAGSTVRVYDNGTLVDTTMANATTGAWSDGVGALPNGSRHSYTATATDGAGNTSAMSGALAFTVDTAAPTITAVADSGPGIDANGNGDLNAGRTVTFTATTSEPVYVTPGPNGATPTVTFNDGGVATYAGPTGTATGTLTFSYTVQAGQNTAALAVAGVQANGAAVTDAAGNPIDVGSLATATEPSGTLVIDTAPPVVSSPTDTVAQNGGATPIGIAAPSDNLTAAGNLAIAAGSLPTDGTVTLADGRTPVVAGQRLTAAQLTGLAFTPTLGLNDQGSTFTYTVTDGAGNSSTGTAALNVGSAGAPTIAGTHATADQAEAPVAPFTGVTVADPSAAAGATETLTIQLTGQGGRLTGTGLTAGPNGSYQLAGTAALVTQELDALTFTPTAGAPGATTSTNFVLTDRSSAGTSVADSRTTVTDTAAPAVTPPGTVPPPVTTPPPAPDAVAFADQVFYGNGAFTLSGTVSSPFGVRGVEITADVDGVATDLGAATVNAEGTFVFSDAIGATTQGFITATLTDGAGRTAAAQASYSLTGGRGGAYPAEQDRYNADGSAVVATDRFTAGGSQRARLDAPGGETFASASFDTFDDAGAPLSTFVFNPGAGRETVNGFRVDGADHDTLSFRGADFGDSIADVLNSVRNVKGGLLITDPTASSPGPGGHDTVFLKGITKGQLAQNGGDIAFHA